jgi:hypothetical protein
MKCQFCQQRCSLQKNEDYLHPNYTSTSLNWICRQHPIEVKQVVYCQRYSLRGNYQQKGEIRYWNNTTLTWLENSKLFRANFFRDGQEEPSHFVLETSKKNFSDLPEIDWNHSRLNNGKFFDFDWAIDLEGHPKDITPENIQTKMKTYLVFS